MPPLRARLGAAFAARLSPEHTRRATLFERLTVARLSWDTLVRIYRHLELVGKLATGIWVGFITSVVLGVDWKPVVEGVFNTGTPIAEALLLAILLPTLLFLAARSLIGFARWRVQRELWRRRRRANHPGGVRPGHPARSETGFRAVFDDEKEPDS